MKVLVQGKNPRWVSECSRILRKHKIEISDNPEILISIGGDGSTLRNYKRYRTAILPVRTFESQGYTSDVGIEDFNEVCEKLVQHLFYVEKRIVLEVHRNRRRIGLAINDVTITQIPKEAMRYSVYVDGTALFGYEKMMGDGIIIATPTGSTGYNRSAGGYILEAPNEIVLTLRYPVFLGSQERRSKILSEDSTIELRFYRPEEALVVIDNDFQKISNSDEIVVRKSHGTFDLVRIRGLEEDRSSKEERREQWFGRQLFQPSILV